MFSGKHLEAFSKLKNVDEGNYKTGNIGVTVQNELRTVGKETRMQKILYLYSFCGNLEEECGLKTLRMPTKQQRPDLWGMDMGINGNLLSLLGLKPFNRSNVTTTHYSENSEDSRLDQLEDILVEGNTEGSLPENYGNNGVNLHSTSDIPQWKLIR